MRASRSRSQAGFSMIEMLMAAFILAIGILGLSMLQAMSLRSARGSRSLGSAVELANRTLDQIELEGRLSWLNLTDSSAATPVALTTLQYVGKGTQYLGFQEDTSVSPVVISPVSTGPVATKPTLSGAIRYVATITEGTTGAGTASSAGTGVSSIYGVKVEFADDVNGTGALVVRSVNLTRSIIHG